MKIDPNTGVVMSSVSLEDVGKVVCNVYNKGKVYLGVEDQIELLKLILTETHTDFAIDIPVAGGDLVFLNDDLYLATREGK